AVHVANDGIRIVLIQRLQLGLGLQNQTSRDFPAADGGHQLFQVRDLADVGALVNQAAYMDRQPPAIYVICLFAQQVEQLGVNHRDQEVEGAVRIGHDEEQCCFPVTQGVQLQLIVGRNLPKLRNIKGGQAGTAGNKVSASRNSVL